jgi:hypothetical protein
VTFDGLRLDSQPSSGALHDGGEEEVIAMDDSGQIQSPQRMEVKEGKVGQ